MAQFIVMIANTFFLTKDIRAAFAISGGADKRKLSLGRLRVPVPGCGGAPGWGRAVSRKVPSWASTRMGDGVLPGT
jgi:hypothetical protein